MLEICQQMYRNDLVDLVAFYKYGPAFYKYGRNSTNDHSQVYKSDTPMNTNDTLFIAC